MNAIWFCELGYLYIDAKIPPSPPHIIDAIRIDDASDATHATCIQSISIGRDHDMLETLN